MAGRTVVQAFGDRHEGATRGERFVLAHDPATAGSGAGVSGVVGGTAFASNSPIICLGHASATKRLAIDTVTLSQNGTVAGGQITYVCAYSKTDLTTVSGTGGDLLTPINMSGDAQGNTTSVTTAHAKRTVAALGPLLFVASRTAPATLGTTTVITFGEGLIIPKTGTFLIYAFAATTGPTVRYDITWREWKSVG
jgi:hypothetical protein